MSSKGTDFLKKNGYGVDLRPAQGYFVPLCLIVLISIGEISIAIVSVNSKVNICNFYIFILWLFNCV
jgi:hypothetical protein